jgi:hypothetical protein
MIKCEKKVKNLFFISDVPVCMMTFFIIGHGRGGSRPQCQICGKHVMKHFCAGTGSVKTLLLQIMATLNHLITYLIVDLHIALLFISTIWIRLCYVWGLLVPWLWCVTPYWWVGFVLWWWFGIQYQEKRYM